MDHSWSLWSFLQVNPALDEIGFCFVVFVMGGVAGRGQISSEAKFAAPGTCCIGSHSDASGFLTGLREELGKAKGRRNEVGWKLGNLT